MTDADATANLNDWNARVIEEFRANGGELSGNFDGAPVLLLHTTGARTGAERVNPMMYLREDARTFVFASKAGAHTHPDWYHNLVATPQVGAEIGAETLRATARVLDEPERTHYYELQASRYPGFAEYRDKTPRVIPVVELVFA